jgi:hypothetical protein
MTDPAQLAQARARVSSRGMTAADIAWADGIGWSAAAVPPVRGPAEAADYERRERLLNAAIAHLSFAERGASPEGKLAAAVGAALANWRDKGAGDGE